MREKEYTIDPQGRLSKEVRGGYIVHPVAFEMEQMVPDTEYLVKKREANQMRVKTNRFGFVKSESFVRKPTLNARHGPAFSNHFSKRPA